MESDFKKLNYSNNNAAVLELFSAILDSPYNRGWVQGVVNLLKQLISARSVVLRIYSDGLTVSSVDTLDADKFLVSKNDRAFSLDEEPFWVNDKYVVPLSFEGCLEVAWETKPPSQTLVLYAKIFSLIQRALQMRSDFVSKDKNVKCLETFAIIERILNKRDSLKNRLDELSTYIAQYLEVSRCQIKIFSNDPGVLFEYDLSSEYVPSVLVDAISVVPEYEVTWIKGLKNAQYEALNLYPSKQRLNSAVDLDKLLSIKSICGVPAIYRNKALGVIVLHQCDYQRSWQEHEISYLKQIGFMLGIVLGNETGISKITESSIVLDERAQLLNQDEFLRELSHVQVHSQTSALPFSLMLISIHQLKEINLTLGFVAGNLVVSQTLRHFKKHCKKYSAIARYNNDEFVLILQGCNEQQARIETERLKSSLSSLSVLGVGPVNYNFSFVTYPTHAESISHILTLLTQASMIAQTRGHGGICGVDEINNEPKKWHEIVSYALPEILIERTSLKTGPEFMQTINEQIKQKQKENIYNPDILDSIQSLALALDAKDSYTEGHSKRVSEYAYMLAKYIGLEMQEQEWVRLAAAMHDIGKIGIPESILCKPGKLTHDEFEVMKKHPVIGARILQPIKPLEKVANIVLYHHESWNGLGYPHGLSKSEIPIGSRIVSIVDAYQAMTSDRPYRARLPKEEAITRLNEGKGKQWDPDLIETFLKVIA